jgi:thioredoxin 1
MSSVETVTDQSFEQDVLGADRPVLVDFWAPWCGPCLMLGPVIEAVAEQRGESLKVVKVNVDESPEVAARMGIRSIPTVMLFDQGELQEMFVGVRPRAEIEAMIDRVGQDDRAGRDAALATA